MNNVSIRQASSAPGEHHSQSHACDNSVSDTSEYPLLSRSHFLLADYVLLLTSRLDLITVFYGRLTIRLRHHHCTVQRVSLASGGCIQYMYLATLFPFSLLSVACSSLSKCIFTQ